MHFTGKAGIFAPLSMTEKKDGILSLSPSYGGNHLVTANINLKKLYEAREKADRLYKQFIEQEEITGNENIASYQMEMQRRTSYPASSYVFVLLAVSLATQKKRGGLGINIAIGLTLCAVYVFAMQISQTFAATGLLSIDQGLGRART
jgi:lipopolysaccharide export LptBFGC system permease protein LptF